MIIDARNDTITLSGTIDKNIWAAIQAAAAILLKENNFGIIINCENIKSISEDGMNTFADAFEYITRKNARIIFASPSKEIIELATAVEGVRSKMPVADSVENARKSLNIGYNDIKSGNPEEQILIPLIKDWKKSLDFSVNFFNSKECNIHIIAIIVIPLSVSYSSPLPKEEQEALFNLSEAEKILHSNIKCQVFKHIIRARNYFEALDKFAILGKSLTAVISDNSSYIEKYHEQDNLSTYVESDSYTSIVTSFLEDFNFKPKNILIPYTSDWKKLIKEALAFSGEENLKIYMPYPVIVSRNLPLNNFIEIEDFKIIKENVISYVSRSKKEIDIDFFCLPLRSLSEGINEYVLNKKINLIICSFKKTDNEYERYSDFINYMFLNNKCSLVSVVYKK